MASLRPARYDWAKSSPVRHTGNTSVPQTTEPVTAIDGHPVIAVEAGHSDTDDSTVLHVPAIGLVAAGDVVYNNVHQYLAETGEGGLDGWHRALDIVESLHPAHVVAGHKDETRDDAPSNVAQTRRYLDDAARLLAAGPSREEYFFQILRQYPQRVNTYTVWITARRLLKDE